MKRILLFLFLCAVARAGTFFTDTFTDTAGTNLTLHVGELGACWNIPNTNVTTLGPGSAVIANNRLRGNSTSATTYLSSAVPADRAQTITAIFHVETVAGNSPWVGLRLSSEAGTGYRFGYDVSASHWKFQYNNSNGGWTTATIDQAATLTPGQDYTVVFAVNNNGGGTDTVTVTIDGGSPLTAPVSIVNYPGTIGVMFDAAATASTNTTGIHFASISATQTAAAPAFTAAWGFVLIGDSLSVDYGLPSSQTIPQLLSSATRLNTDRFWNTAWPGQSAADQITLYSTQVAPLYPLTSGESKRVAIIFTASNDLSQGASAATILSRLQSLHASAQATGYVTVVVTLPPSAAYDSNANTNRLTLNASIRADHSWANYFSDLALCPDLQDPNSAFFQSDHIHYSVAGRTSAANWIAADMLGTGPGAPSVNIFVSPY